MDGGVVFDNEFIKFLASLGVGGAIAGLLFYFYRRDVRSYTELWKETAAMLTTALKESTAAHVENSATNREMNALIVSLHRRMDIEGWPRYESDRDRQIREERQKERRDRGGH
jgi:hypothetical protein